MRPFSAIGSFLFALVGLMHLGRAIAGATITVEEQVFPMWPSWVAVLVAAVMCVGLWKESRAG